ncbi:amidohydrolase [Polymorphobacter sp.]|uniref:amidohydrolase n=1 Tax=Polymorphobacter sp. TaxID=1909290 RepID=UPI003F6E4BCC
MLTRAFFLALALPAAALAAPDAIYLNGKVFTAEDSRRTVSAFAVEGNRFTATGSDAEIRKLAGPSTRIVDLKGRFVTPGLTDAHFHTEGGGPDVDLSKAQTLADVFAAIKAAADKAKPGDIILTNSDWHEMQLKDQRLPLATELDAVAPNNPVVVVRGGHSLILNTAALNKWNITTATKAPPGGAITKDDKGNLTGELLDRAKSFVTLPPPPAVTTADVMTTQQVLNSYGITSVRVIGSYKTGSAEAWKLFQQVKDQGALSVRYNVFLRTNADPSDAEAYVRTLEAPGLKQGQGDEWIRIGGIKMGVDGGFEGGHMTDAYLEPFGQNGTYYGLETITPAHFGAIVAKLHDHGWTVATHACGDAAVEQVLKAYEAANRTSPIAGRKWAIEHAFVTNADQIKRSKDLDLTLSVQNHLYVAAPAFKRYLGLPRAVAITPLKSYIDGGLKLALGTDAPVIPVNPFWNLYHYITRDTASDGVYGTEQSVKDRGALLRLMTAGYAELTGEESIKGRIAPGQLADFAVLSADYLTIPDAGVKQLKALGTWVGGKQVFADPMLADAATTGAGK